MLPACRSAWRGGFDGRRLRFRGRSIPRANETEQAAPTPHGMPPASRTEKRMTLDLTLPRYVRPLLGCAAGAFGCLLWSYWPTLLETAQRWSHDPQYSH